MHIIFWIITFFISFLKDQRKDLITIYKMNKKKTKFQWTEECKKAFSDIKELLIILLVLYMLTANNKFKLESNRCKITAGVAQF